MSHRRPFALAVFGATLLAAQAFTAPAVAAPAHPARLEGMVYVKARPVILSYGWKPWRPECDEGEDTCDAFPELEVCSVSMPVHCVMRFQRGRRCLVVTTLGESPPGEEAGDPLVDEVGFNDKACTEIFPAPAKAIRP